MHVIPKKKKVMMKAEPAGNNSVFYCCEVLEPQTRPLLENR